MKNMKKALALLLAAVMLLAMSAVAMAATPTGSITVTGLEQWAEVKIYQLIEMPFDETNDQYGDVQWTSEMQAWLDANGNTTKPTEAPSSDEEHDTAQLYQDLYAAIKAGTVFTVVKNGQAAADGTSLTFDGLTAGSYMVIVSGGAKEHQPYVVSLKPEFEGSAWSIEGKSVDATTKASEPTIDKTVNKDNVSITDTVTFTITTSVPKYAANATNIKYWISDEMDEGLTYIDAVTNNLQVKGNGTDLLTAGDHYTIESFEGSASAGKKGLFTLKFDYDKIRDYNTIVVSYTATVNDKIVVGANDNDNKATFDYTNGSKSDTECVYTYGIKIVKTNTAGETLSGAEFVLKDANGVELKFVKDGNVYKLNASGDTKLVSDDQGNIQIDGLAEGTYTLVETKAPDTYNLLRAPMTIKLTKDSENKVNLANNTSAYDEEKVVNSKGMIVPSTGGMGTTIFMVAGIVIMACAVVTLMLLLKRQKSGSEG